MSVISPSVGRSVHFFVKETQYNFEFCFVQGKPHAAVVTYVHGDRMVNLAVFDTNGKPFGYTSVNLVQPGETTDGYAFWCQWPQHTQEQAAEK